MSATFTPGPWRYTDDCGTLVIRQKRDDDGFEDYIASTWGGKNEADARLIAAAPELLVALEAAESAMSHPVHAFEVLAEHSVVREMIRAAIAKATGAT